MAEENMMGKNTAGKDTEAHLIRLQNGKYQCDRCKTGWAPVQIPYSFRFCPSCGAKFAENPQEKKG